MLEGRLSEFSLADVFQLLALTGKTGVLRVTTEGDGRVHFDGGAVTYAVADVRRLTLGARLVQACELDTDLLDQVAEAQRTGDLQRLQRLLTGDGALDEETLAHVLREEIADAVFALMRADEGSFAFDSAASTGTPLVSLDGAELVAQGGERLTEWDRLRERVGPPETVLALAPRLDGDTVTIEAEEWQLLAQVHGSRTAAELADLTGRGEFATYRVLSALLDRGLVETCDPGTAAATGSERHAATGHLEEDAPAVPPEPSPEASVEPSPEPYLEPSREEPSLEPSVPSASANGQAAVGELRRGLRARPAVTKPVSPGPAVPRPAVPDEDAAPARAAAAAPEGESAGLPPPSAADWQEVLGLSEDDAPAPEPLPEPEPEPDPAPPAPSDHRTEPGTAPSPSWETEELHASADVDRASMARELAALGFGDDAAPGSPRPPVDPATDAAPTRRLTRDEAVSKGLLLRLIDGVKGV